MGAVAIILLVAVTVVEAGRMLKDARRARRINRAMHELRRPLQAIALSLEAAAPDLRGAGACLDQARAALRDLDAVVNGRTDPPPVRRVPVAEVLDALDRRWAFADVEVEPAGADIEIDADPMRLGAALDNLVGNALRHGSGIVRVRANAAGGYARFEVRDDGPSRQASGKDRRRSDPRHGHGLEVIADVVAGHGGEVTPAASGPGGGTLAAISLPLPGRAVRA